MDTSLAFGLWSSHLRVNPNNGHVLYLPAIGVLRSLSSFLSIYVPWRLGTRLFQPSFCAMFHSINFVSNTHLANHPVSCLCSLMSVLSHSPYLFVSINRLLLSTCHPTPLLYFLLPTPFPCTLSSSSSSSLCSTRVSCSPLALLPPSVLLALFSAVHEMGCM